MLESAADAGCTISFEQHDSLALEKDSAKERVAGDAVRWARSKESRIGRFRVYKIDAFIYGIPTQRSRCIVTNFDLPFEQDLVTAVDVLSDDGTRRQTGGGV